MPIYVRPGVEKNHSSMPDGWTSINQLAALTDIDPSRIRAAGITLERVKVLGRGRDCVPTADVPEIVQRLRALAATSNRKDHA